MEVVNGEVVVGVTILRDKHSLRVRLLMPYCNWVDELYITGMGKMLPRHFLTPYGDADVRRLIIESYRKLKIIDGSIDRICRVYDKLKEELLEKDKLEQNEVTSRIRRKLQDWVFKDFLFTSSVTGSIASYSEEDKIEQIILAYKNEGKKIYLNEE